MVVSQSGLKAARYFEEKHAIPYIVGIPIGETTIERYKKDIEEAISKKVTHTREELLRKECCGNSTACIITEQVMGNSLRECLIYEMGFERVNVCSFFEMDSSLSQSGDIHLQSEDDLKALVSSNRFDVIVGDPLLKPLVGNIPLIPFPHIAISSRIYWDKPVSYFGCNGSRYFHQFINSLGV